MCGIVGIATTEGARADAIPVILARMRDRLTHRGPDDAGLRIECNVGLGHTRLAVVDPSPAGHQPMTTSDGQHVLVYNGELYNDRELRSRLMREGVGFSSSCDAETVLAALAHFGVRALGMFRGMFALAWLDRGRHKLVLARDPLGIKPLYEWRGPARGGQQVAFASEPAALLAHPDIPVRPDFTAVSGYLTTIRTVQGERTLFEGIRAVRPGAWIEFDLAGDGLSARQGAVAFEPTSAAGDDVRTAIEDSIRRHMRSDVPMCSLLSGGLDSSIIASVARHHHPRLHTYCAGANSPECSDDDLSIARQVADQLGVQHHEALIDQELFLSSWQEMVARMGVPLSTPNEVAIYQVAQQLRADGHVVALSGEGADELFAGYDRPLTVLRQFFIEHPGATLSERAAFELETLGWVGPSLKPSLFEPDAFDTLGRDEALLNWLEGELLACDAQACAQSSDALLEQQLSAHLLLQQRVNLAGLLQRLDSATMLASVEGRTPIADVAIASLANALPLDRKITWTAAGPRTKIALRTAFEDVLPPIAVSRPKASFPLPFISWMTEIGSLVRTSEIVRSLLREAAVEAVAAAPADLWRLAWPMLNMALWERVWWGPGQRICPASERPLQAQPL